MENKTLEEVAKELLSFPGKVKGDVFLNHAEYIKLKEGEGAVKKLEDKMAELGAPIKFNEIKPTEWESEGLSSLVIVVAKDLFNWTDKDIFEWGRFRTRVSFIVKMMTRMLVSVKKLVDEAPKHWSRNFDFGSIEITLNEEEKKMVVLEKDFKTHPLVCIFHAGYFKGMLELCVRSNNIKVEEVRCAHKGDDYHEYVVTW